MINLYLNGASGRMGAAVKSIISETNDFNLLDKIYVKSMTVL